MGSSEIRAERSKRSLVFLAVGSAAGIALAIASILAPPAPLSPEIASALVATVNGRPIRRASYDRTSAGLVSDLNRGLTEEERQRVLDRLIDEELLVQQGLALDLPQLDSHVRSTLVGVVIETVVANAESEDADPESVRTFFEENGEYFTRPGKLSVRQIFFSAYDDENASKLRAEQALARLKAGQAFERVAADLGHREVVPLPRGLTGVDTLREILGPTALAATMALNPGERSSVVRSGTGFHVIELLERQPLEVPAFESIEELVAAEYRRRQGERALRDTLEELRGRADIRFADEVR
jgi:parvulin-like peptidyl-prolyl isomerase